MAWDGIVAALQISDELAVAALAAELPGSNELAENLTKLNAKDYNSPPWARLSAALQRKLASNPTTLRPTGASPLSTCADRAGWTLLHFAAHTGRSRCLKLLLALGAEPRRRNGVGQQAKHLAPPGGTCERVLTAAEATLKHNEASRRASNGTPAFLLADTAGLVDLTSSPGASDSTDTACAPLSVEAAFAGLDEAFQVDDNSGVEEKATSASVESAAASDGENEPAYDDSPPDEFWGTERAAAITGRALRRARIARAAAEANVAKQEQSLAALDHEARKLKAAANRRAERAREMEEVVAERRWASEAADAAFPKDRQRAHAALARAEVELSEAKAAAARLAKRAVDAQTARDNAHLLVAQARGQKLNKSVVRSGGGGGGTLYETKRAYMEAWQTHGAVFEADRKVPPQPPPPHVVATRGKAEDWITPPAAKSLVIATTSNAKIGHDLDTNALARATAELAAADAALARRRARASNTAVPSDAASNAAETTRIATSKTTAGVTSASVASYKADTALSLTQPPQCWLVHCRPMRLQVTRDFPLFQAPTTAPSAGTTTTSLMLSGSESNDGNVDSDRVGTTASTCSHLGQRDDFVDLVLRVSYARPTARTRASAAIGNTEETALGSGVRSKAVLFESPSVRLHSSEMNTRASAALSDAFTARLPLTEQVIAADLYAPQQPGSLVITILQRLAPSGAPVDGNQRKMASNPRANKVIAEGRVLLSALLKSTTASSQSTSLNAKIRRTPLTVWAEATPSAAVIAAAANTEMSLEMSGIVGSSIKVELELTAMPNGNDSDSDNEGNLSTDFSCPVLASAARSDLRNLIRRSQCWSRGSWLPYDMNGNEGNDCHQITSSRDGSKISSNNNSSIARVSKASIAADATKATRAFEATTKRAAATPMAEKTNSAAVFPTAAALRNSLTEAGDNRINRYRAFHSSDLARSRNRLQAARVLQKKVEAPPLRAPRNVGGVWTLEAYTIAQAKASASSGSTSDVQATATTAKKGFAALSPQEQLQWGRDSALWWACNQNNLSSGNLPAQPGSSSTNNVTGQGSTAAPLVTDPETVRLNFQLMRWDPNERPAAVPLPLSLPLMNRSTDRGPVPNEVDLEALRFFHWHRKHDPGLTPVLRGTPYSLALEAATVLLAGPTPGASSPNSSLEKWPSGVLLWNDASSPPPPPLPSHETATHGRKSRGDSAPATAAALLLRPYFVQPRKVRSRSGSTNRCTGEEEWNQEALYVFKDLLAAAKPQQPAPPRALKFLAAPRAKSSLPPTGSVPALVSRFTSAWQHAQRQHASVQVDSNHTGSTSRSTNHGNNHDASPESNERTKTKHALSLVAALVVHGPQSHEVSKAVKSMQRNSHHKSSGSSSSGSNVQSRHSSHYRSNFVSHDAKTNTVAAHTTDCALNSVLSTSSSALLQGRNSSHGSVAQVRWLARFMLSAAIGWLLRRADSEEEELRTSHKESNANDQRNTTETSSRTSSFISSSSNSRPYRALLVALWQNCSEPDIQGYSDNNADFLINALGWSPEIAHDRGFPRMRQPRQSFLNLVCDLDRRRRLYLHGLHRPLVHDDATVTSARSPVDSVSLQSSVAQLSVSLLPSETAPVQESSTEKSTISSTVQTAEASSVVPSTETAATKTEVPSSTNIPAPGPSLEPNIGALIGQKSLSESDDSSEDDVDDSSSSGDENQSFDFEHYFAAQAVMLNAPPGSRAQSQAADEVAALRRSLRASMANLTVPTPPPPPPSAEQPDKLTTATALSQLLLTGAGIPSSTSPAAAGAANDLLDASKGIHPPVEAPRAADEVASSKRTSAQELPDKDSTARNTARSRTRANFSQSNPTFSSGDNSNAEYHADHRGEPNNIAWHVKRSAFVKSTVKWMTGDGPSRLLDGLLAIGRGEDHPNDANNAIAAAAAATAAAAIDARTQLAQFLVNAFLDLRPALGRCLWDPGSASGTLVTEVAALQE